MLYMFTAFVCKSRSGCTSKPLHDGSCIYNRPAFSDDVVNVHVMRGESALVHIYTLYIIYTYSKMINPKEGEN